MNILLVGTGLSAIEYQDYAEFNNFDKVVGCRQWLTDPAWSFDKIAVPKLSEIRFIQEYFPQAVDRVISNPIIMEKLGLPHRLPYSSHYTLIEHIQTKWAVLQKPDTITTVGYDLLFASVREYDCPVYRKANPIQKHQVNLDYRLDRIRRVRSMIRETERIYNRIEWRHLPPRHINQPLYSFLEKKQGI